MDLPLIVAIAAVLVPATGGLIKFGLDWHNRQREHQEFKIEGNNWVLESRDSYEEFLRDLLGLDRASLPGLTELAAGNEYIKSHVFEKSYDTWGLVVFRDQLVVAYWSCFSLSKRLISRLSQGVMYDSEINVENIHQLSEHIPHNLYFEMVGVLPAFKNNRKVKRLLFTSMARFVQHCEQSDVRVEGVYATGFTKYGVALCRRFGLNVIADAKQGGDVYHSDDISSVKQRLMLLVKSV